MGPPSCCVLSFISRGRKTEWYGVGRGNEEKCLSRHGKHDGGLSEVMGSDGKNESLGPSGCEVVAKKYDSKVSVGQPCGLPLQDPPKRIPVWADAFDDEWLPPGASTQEEAKRGNVSGLLDHPLGGVCADVVAASTDLGPKDVIASEQDKKTNDTSIPAVVSC